MSLNWKLSSMVITYNLQTNLFKIKKISYVDKFYDKVNLEPVTFPLMECPVRWHVRAFNSQSHYSLLLYVCCLLIVINCVQCL